MTPAVDFTGRTIEPGDTVAYPVRRGSAMWLNKLNVTQVLDDSIAGYNPAGRLLSVRNLQNVIILPKQEPV